MQTVTFGRVELRHAAHPMHSCTDLGNARRLIEQFGHELRYVPPWRTWLWWDSRRWARDETGEVQRRAKVTVEAIADEARAEDDEARRKELQRHWMRSESHARIQAMIELAKTEPGIPLMPGELDSSSNKLNILNGTLDLELGGILRDHDPADLLTKLAPVEYQPHTEAPRFMRFLDEIFASDESLITALQRAVGYTLTGLTIDQVMFVLWGSGSNGKTTLLEVLRRLLGDYASATDSGTFMASPNPGVRNDLARLAGARLVTAVEVERGKRLSESLIKRITGGDTVVARFLYAEFFEFVTQFKVWLAVNTKPVIRGTEHAIWRRIRLIPFTVTIPDELQDPLLVEELWDERSGILRWALEGCMAWQRKGLGDCDAVRNATETYRAEMDILGGFLEDCCEIVAGVQTAATALYEAYNSWCEKNGERAMSQRLFGQALGERGFEKGKRDPRTGRITRLGVRLLNDVNTPEALSPKLSHVSPHVGDMGRGVQECSEGSGTQYEIAERQAIQGEEAVA